MRLSLNLTECQTCQEEIPVTELIVLYRMPNDPERSGEVAFCKIERTHETISDIGLDNASTRVHPSGTVLVGMIGEGKTRGQAAILDMPAANNQNCAAIREFQKPPTVLSTFTGIFGWPTSRPEGWALAITSLPLTKIASNVFLSRLPPLVRRRK